MSLINFILKLLLAFVPFEENEYANLKSDAENWWSGIRYPLDMKRWDEKKVKEFLSLEENKDLNIGLVRFKFICNFWFVRLLFSVLYIFGHREVAKFMNPKQEEIKKGDF